MPLISLVDKKDRECYFIDPKHYKKIQIPILINLLRTYILAKYPHRYKVEVLEKSDKKLNGYYTAFITNNRTREIIRTTLRYIGG